VEGGVKGRGLRARRASVDVDMDAIGGKENQPLSQKGQRTVQPKKTARIGEWAMLRRKPVLRDILNEVMDGGC